MSGLLGIWTFLNVEHDFLHGFKRKQQSSNFYTSCKKKQLIWSFLIHSSQSTLLMQWKVVKFHRLQPSFQLCKWAYRGKKKIYFLAFFTTLSFTLIRTCGHNFYQEARPRSYLILNRFLVAPLNTTICWSGF